MVKVNDLLDNINETVNELRELGDSLRNQLNVASQNLTDLKTSCQADPAASMLGICDNITDGLSLFPKADYRKVRINIFTASFLPPFFPLSFSLSIQ